MISSTDGIEPIAQLSVSDNDALSVSSLRIGDAAVVQACGEVDPSTSWLLRTIVTRLLDAGETQLVLDLAGVTFLDAAGLGVIADASARLAEGGAVLGLRGVPTMTRRLLTLTGMDDHVRIDPLPVTNATR